MAEAIDIHGSAFKNGSVTLLARIVDEDGGTIVQADVSAIRYTVYLLDDQDADHRTPIEGHANASVSVAAVIYNSLQTESIWTVDQIGYNFRHALDVSVHPAFATAGRRYLVEYQLTPASGQTIIVRFRINVV